MRLCLYYTRTQKTCWLGIAWNLTLLRRPNFLVDWRPEQIIQRITNQGLCLEMFAKIPVCLWGVLNLTRPALFICKTQFLPRARFLLFVPRPSRVTSFYLFLIKKSLFSLFFVYIRNNFSLAGSWEIERELSIIFISWIASIFWHWRRHWPEIQGGH